MAAVSLQKSRDTTELTWYLNLKLAALGQPTGDGTAELGFLQIAQPLLRNYETKDRLLRDHLCPADTRIQSFLSDYLSAVCPTDLPRLPSRTLVLDRPGLARVMSLPPDASSFFSPFLSSYRVHAGEFCTISRSSARTTQGVFHIAEGGFPIPADKQPVPIQTFAALLRAALAPPDDVLTLPFTANQKEQAKLFVSLLIRPLVCPATGTDPAKTMETRFFAPASLVSNLDFVESIFGNGGDPHLPENDAGLDAMHWTGHTGCVILAPHLVGMKKAALGLPRPHPMPLSASAATACAGKAKTNPTTRATPLRFALGTIAV